MPFSTLCLGYTSYRLETLPFIRPMMEKFECIVLEEPHTPGFTEMLSQDLDIDEDLLLTDFGFPVFAHSKDFSRTLAAVKDFARIDALKGRLRDEMRAKALEEVFGHYQSVYVEAGYIHFALLRELHRLLPEQTRMSTFYSQKDYFRPRNCV